MNPRLLIAVLVAAGAAACGQQTLTGGPGTGGTTGAGGTIGAGGTTGTGGFGPACPGKLTCWDSCLGEFVVPSCEGGALYCPPSTGCEDGGPSGTGGTGGPPDGGGCPNEVLISCVGECEVGPVCLDGAWTCVPDMLCVADAGIAKDGGGSKDAGGTKDGGGTKACGPVTLGCTQTCNTDVGVPAVCVNGTWQCPVGAFPFSNCPPRCPEPPRPGCTCDLISGALTCQQDAGAAAGGNSG